MSGRVSSPAVHDFWRSALESQGVRERYRSTQEALLFGLILVDQKTVNIALPVANVLAVKGVVLICGVGVTDGSFDFLHETKLKSELCLVENPGEAVLRRAHDVSGNV